MITYDESEGKKIIIFPNNDYIALPIHEKYHNILSKSKNRKKGN